MHRPFLTVAASLGALAVLLGAFGAHGLRKSLAPLADGAVRLEWWQTAAQYHLAHALALGLVAAVAADGRAGRISCIAFIAGITVFSGTLYAMALGAPRWFGAITPLGGIALIVGWVSFAIAAWPRS